ncbi:hypothetical protein BKA70DRAFT_1368461 [Coprinopsis sp. MPI-PUGE-AT-0042]|nr:hypothetical protein BKA70DRAFT_1368461 [Coprinopsis sp. MPI-PUGE-AT-0042]
MTFDHKQHIVIVGGGAAGAAIAKEIVPSLDSLTHTLTLITSRPFFINAPAMLRMAVTSEGSLEELALMPYGDALRDGKRFEGTVKIGKAVRFTSNDGGHGGGEVILEGGESVPYSVLVLATGNTWTGPMNYPEADFLGTKSHLDYWRYKFGTAKNVVIVGGGVVGMELAGEIKDFYPDTEVTIIQRDSELLNGSYPARFRSAALKRVHQTGAKVILDDSVEAFEPSSDGTVKTKKGRVVKADLVIPCAGGRPNTSIISSSLGPHVLTPSGHVKIKPTLQVQGYPRIFAAGDIIDFDEQKQAAKAMMGHMPIVKANILALTGGSVPSKVYRGSTELIVIVTGRSGGLLYTKPFLGIGIIMGDFVVRWFKSKGLLIESMRGWYGLGNLSPEKSGLVKA